MPRAILSPGVKLKRTSMQLRPDQVARLEEVAAAEDRSVSSVLRRMLDISLLKITCDSCTSEMRNDEERAA